MNSKKPHSKSVLQGFTLIEILLTVSLLAISSLAIYKVFSGGLKLWAYAQRSGIEEDVSIFFDKFSQDLRHAFYYKGIEFNGTETRVTIPCFVTTQADPNSVHADEGWVTQIGSVNYYYDFETHTIHRKQANYSQALSGRSDDDKVLVKSVNSIKFKYFLPGAQGIEPYAKMEAVIPPVMFVEIRYSDGRSEHVIGRMISIPVGI
jgi:prepilin-type N-terminal cleavage/methylation domain-containing protein